MNKLSARQVYFLLACILPVGKLILLPARLADVSKNDLLLPAALHLLLQAGAVFCALLLAKRNMSLFEMLEGTLGHVAACVLQTVFALFLLFAALLPVLEQKLLVQSVFYDTLPTIASFAPFFLFAAYACSKPLASFGRMWDMLAPFSLAGYFGILLLSVGSADLAALAPTGAAGASGFFGGTMSAFAWFYDAALLLPLLGKIDYTRGMAWKGMLFYLAGGAGVLIFLAVFYGIFQETSVNQLYAFTATSKYFSGIATLGRADYLFIIVLTLVMTFSCILPIQGAIECALQAYGRKRWLAIVLSVGASLVFLILVLVLDYRFGEILAALSGVLFWIFPLFCLALPPLLLLFGRNDRARA